MDQANLPGETTQKAMNSLRREGDLRDQNNCLPAVFDHFFGGTQINFCLARPGYPLK